MQSSTCIRLLAIAVLLGPVAGCGALGTGRAVDHEEIIDYGRPTEYLTCVQAGAGARVDTVVGPGGATIRAGGTELTIPAKALSGIRRFVLQQDTGQRVSVTIGGEMGRVAPPPLDLPATLRVDVSGCAATSLANPRGWWVWRINDQVPDSSQKLRTRINRRHAITMIDSTSKFMIAN